MRGCGDPQALALEQLVDEEATCDNRVRQFRQHLGQSRAGNVVLFHDSGHGVRWASAPEFRPDYPDAQDEGLVCIDSRRPGGHCSGLLARGEPLVIPTSRRILLAACERTQQAKETTTFHGVFTATLPDGLARSGGKLS